MDLRLKLCGILREAGEQLRTERRFSVTEKAGHANYVTDADRRMESMLKQQLRGLCPEARFIGEEEVSDRLTDEPTWVVDPIDGTTNFIHDYHMSAISAALLTNRRPLVGAVVQPWLGEVYSAERGKGAFLNDAPMHVSGHDLGHALTGFGTSPYHPELSRPTMEIALKFMECAADVRRCGSAALDLAYVACGRQDIFFELTLKPWDVAAGALLVTEAGGVFDMPPLENPDFDTAGTILAANALCAVPARALLAEQMKKYGLDREAIMKLSD